MVEARIIVNDDYPRDANGAVIERILIRQKDVEFVVRDEPFIGSKRTISNESLRVDEFSQFYLPGNALWEVELC